MKIRKKNLIPIAILAFAGPVFGGTVTLNLAFGALRDASGTAVPDGTTVFIIANSNTSSGALPGGLQDTQSGGGLDSTLALSHFAGADLTVGQTVNLDQIIYVGSVNGIYGPGSLDWQNVSITTGVSGVNSGTNFGVYWFPGLSGTSVPSSGGFQIGGLFNSQPIDPSNLSDVGMSIPSDGSVSLIAQVDPDIANDIGASTPHTAASFTAIAVPEASSLALSALGLGALLRRRRK